MKLANKQPNFFTSKPTLHKTKMTRDIASRVTNEHKKTYFSTRKPSFKYFCEICAIGDGIIECVECQGEGMIPTRMGGAGERLLIGLARCKLCHGMGRIPCPLCTGAKGLMRPPRSPEFDLSDFGLTLDESASNTSSSSSN